jgi:hypothetical protein
MRNTATHIPRQFPRVAPALLTSSSGAGRAASLPDHVPCVCPVSPHRRSVPKAGRAVARPSCEIRHATSTLIYPFGPLRNLRHPATLHTSFALAVRIVFARQLPGQEMRGSVECLWRKPPEQWK